MKANRPVLVPRRPSVLPFGCQRVGCDRILLPLSPPGRKITSKRAGNPENAVKISDAWQLQTKESAEWDRLYRAEERTLTHRTTDIARERNIALDLALSQALQGLVGVPHGRSNVPRRLARLRSDEKAPADALPVRIYNGYQSDLPAVERDIAALPDTDPSIHVLIPDEERAALDAWLRQRMAAQSVLDTRGAPQTTEGEQAQRAMETRRKTAEDNIIRITKQAVAEARVFQAGGATISGSLKDALQKVAQNALVRLYPQFDQADHPSWATVVTRGQAGQLDALQAVDHNGPPETHAVCHALRQALGAGRRGAELRSTFEAAPFGWPRDAVDGALLVMDNADLIRTVGEDGQETALRSLARNRFGRPGSTSKLTTSARHSGARSAGSPKPLGSIRSPTKKPRRCRNCWSGWKTPWRRPAEIPRPRCRRRPPVWPLSTACRATNG